MEPEISEMKEWGIQAACSDSGAGLGWSDIRHID